MVTEHRISPILGAAPVVLIIASEELQEAYRRGLAHADFRGELRFLGHGLAHEDVEQHVSDPRLEVVVNVPGAAGDLAFSQSAIAAGKHVYEAESTFQTVEHLRGLAAAADRAGVVFGSGPDTVLGATVRTAAAVLADGELGTIAGIEVGVPARVEGDPLWERKLRCALAALMVLLGESGPGAEALDENEGGCPRGTLPAGARIRMPETFDGDRESGGLILEGSEGGRLRLGGLLHYDRDVEWDPEGTGRWEAVDRGLRPTTDRAGRLFRGPGVVELLGHLNGGPHRTAGVRAAEVLELCEQMRAAASMRTGRHSDV